MAFFSAVQAGVRELKENHWLSEEYRALSESKKMSHCCLWTCNTFATMIVAAGFWVLATPRCDDPSFFKVMKDDVCLMTTDKRAAFVVCFGVGFMVWEWIYNTWWVKVEGKMAQQVNLHHFFAITGQACNIVSGFGFP